MLDKISVTLTNPELNLDGLLWLAVTPPTAEDALPSFDNWLNPIEEHSLRTPDPRDLYPPPFVIRINQLTLGEAPSTVTPAFSSAILATFDFTYATNDEPVFRSDTSEKPPTIYERLLGRTNGLYDINAYWSGGARRPLVWRRHATAPTIQSLPMTQRKTPPNYPSPNRQLFPFVLPVDEKTEPLKPGEWRFQSTGGMSWPTLVSEAAVAVLGKSYDGLTLVSLGLPGLVFDPNVPQSLFATPFPADKILPAQYRHEVALLDEVNALAMIPKDEQPHDPGDSPPPPPPGMAREDYDDHWKHLAELAFSATAEARDTLIQEGGKTLITGLIEPFKWQVSATLTSAPYPGRVTFTESGGKSISFAGTTSDALRGIEGPFRRAATKGTIELADTTTTEFTVVAESMAAILDTSGTLRDQRGLYREATRTIVAGGSTWLKTTVALADDTDGNGRVNLLSTMAPISLTANSGNFWEFWCRDLPTLDGGATSTFDRNASHSTQRRGENNPAALTRRLNHMIGYEWRMGLSGMSPLPLGPLWFYPLCLQTATFDPASGLSSLVVLGRLHLPYDGKPPQASDEPEDRSNAVALTFLGGVLKKVEIASLDLDDASTPTPPKPAVNEWPLADLNTYPDAPILRWTDIKISSDNSGIELTVQLHYVRHGVSWTFPTKTLVITWTGKSPDLVYDDKDTQAAKDAVISVKSVRVSLDFTAAASSGASSMPALGHTVTATWQFVWGKIGSGPLQLIATSDVAVLAKRLPSGGVAPSMARSAKIRVSETKQLDLDLEDLAGTTSLSPNLDAGGVQLEWSGITSPSTKVQVLPGFFLSPDAARVSRGFAILSFAMTNDPSKSLPTIDQPRGAFLEALFACDWGYPLQDDTIVLRTGDDAKAATHSQAFGASAGKVDAAFTASFNAAAADHWETTLLLNGLVEFKNLVSWPVGLVSVDPADNLVTIPPARVPGKTQPALNHIRHTARVLFNQHALPVDHFMPGGGSDAPILFRLKENSAWSAEVVVEHQVVVMEYDGEESGKVLKRKDRECRITLTQEVRFCAPERFPTVAHGASTPGYDRPGIPSGGRDIQ